MFLPSLIRCLCLMVVLDDVHKTTESEILTELITSEILIFSSPEAGMLLPEPLELLPNPNLTYSLHACQVSTMSANKVVG